MAKITRKNIKRISEIIREWPAKENVTWSLICAAAELELGWVPTRQALSNKPMLSNAYKTRKTAERDRYNALSYVSVPKSMPDAIEQILGLNKRILALESELLSMNEIAALFIMNASKKGLSKDYLMQSPIKRDRQS